MTGTIQKLQRFTPTPNPTGHKGGWPKIYVKHVQPHPTHTMNQTDDAIHHWNSTTPPPAHTQTGHTPHSAQNKAGEHTHATKVHWHTIEFSNNTSTPKPTHTTVDQSEGDFGIYQRLFSCPPHKPERISLSSGALSVSLTRYKLHTPHTQHKPAAHRLFSTCS